MVSISCKSLCPVIIIIIIVIIINTHLHSSMHLISGCPHSTLVSWLLVLSDVVPSLLCRRASSDTIIEADPTWPVYADVFEHLPPRLAC